MELFDVLMAVMAAGWIAVCSCVCWALVHVIRKDKL